MLDVHREHRLEHAAGLVVAAAICAGSPGGRTIINTVLHITLNIAEFGMALEGALAAPRSHHQWLPDRISIESGLADTTLVQQLEAMGHTVRVGGSQGQAHSITVDPATGMRIAVPDPRSTDAGAAAAPSAPATPGGSTRSLTSARGGVYSAEFNPRWSWFLGDPEQEGTVQVIGSVLVLTNILATRAVARRGRGFVRSPI